MAWQPTEFAVGINGIEIARIRQNLPREIGSDYNPISHFTELPVLINTSHQVFSKLYDEYMQVTEGAVNEKGEWRLSYLDDYSSFEIRKSDDADSFAFSYLMPGCIPAFDKYPSLSLNEKHDSEMTALETNMSVVILQLLFGGRDIALKVLEDIRQIGPLREIPAMDFNNGSGTLCWMNGSYAWKLLADPDANDSYESETHVLPSDSALIEAVSSVLEKLKTGFSLQLLKISSVDGSSSSGIKERLEQAISAAESDAPEDIAAAIQRLLNNSPQSRDVLLKDTVQDVVLYPQDAAMGIVQLVPVVVAMLVGGTNVCSIEQPELHLHPAVQCELGSFFAESIKANRERLALIETHSEHMLLRFQRLIRDKIMSHDDISVVSFTRTPAGSLVTNLRINESGEFLDEWPGGFFEESFNEMFGDGQC